MNRKPEYVKVDADFYYFNDEGDANVRIKTPMQTGDTTLSEEDIHPADRMKFFDDEPRIKDLRVDKQVLIDRGIKF